jgi:hypothetical protein
VTGTRVATLVAVALLLPAAAGAALGQALAVAGADRARIEVPRGAVVEPYANAGYRLRVEGAVAHVDVTLLPLRSRDPFRPPAVEGESDPLATLARAVTTGSNTRYEAASRLLAWVAGNVGYELDRSAPQDAPAVLGRRRAYCTGVARLTVALMEAVDIPAREVPGFLVAPPGGGVPAGYHRWVEVRFDDVGWVFSDPLLSHHYVPATYVRLASETLTAVAAAQAPGRLLGRLDGRRPVDLLSEVPPGVSLRRNSPRQRAAALTISVGDGGDDGLAVLEGRGARRVRSLERGSSTFLGLEPGVYRLRVDVPGKSPVEKQITLRARVAATVHLPSSNPHLPMKETK